MFVNKYYKYKKKYLNQLYGGSYQNIYDHYGENQDFKKKNLHLISDQEQIELEYFKTNIKSIYHNYMSSYNIYMIDDSIKNAKSPDQDYWFDENNEARIFNVINYIKNEDEQMDDIIRAFSYKFIQMCKWYHSEKLSDEDKDLIYLLMNVYDDIYVELGHRQDAMKKSVKAELLKMKSKSLLLDFISLNDIDAIEKIKNLLHEISNIKYIGWYYEDRISKILNNIENIDKTNFTDFIKLIKTNEEEIRQQKEEIKQQEIKRKEEEIRQQKEEEIKQQETKRKQFQIIKPTSIRPT